MRWFGDSNLLPLYYKANVEWAIRLLYILKVLIPVRNNFRVTANSLQILGINFLLNIFFPDIQIKAKDFLKINASFFQKNKKNMVIFA